MASSNDALIQSLSSAIFSKMMDDVLIDIGQRAHREAYRSRTICNVCRTRCRTVHASSPAALTGQFPSGSLTVPSSQQSTSPSRPTTPLSATPNRPTGTNTPITKEKSDVFFDCQNCKRSVASNRYAPHLASCLGLATGARRSNARSATKHKLTTEGSRSNSPQVAVGDETATPPAPARKGRPPKGSTPKISKKKGTHSATPELNSSGKRPASPAVTSPKNTKKLKAGTASPGVPSKGLPPPPASVHRTSYPKVPSRLRASSPSSPLAKPMSLAGSSPSNVMDLELASLHSSPHSTTPLSRSGSPESVSLSARANRGSKTIPGKTAPPGYPPPRPTAPMSVTSHNDPGYDDADDLADTDSSADDDGDDD